MQILTDGDQLPFEKVTLKEWEVVLEKYRYKRNFRLSQQVMDSIRIEKIEEPYISGALYELSCAVLAEKLIDRTVRVWFTNPSTWWDMFKIRFFSEWLLDIFSPKYTTTIKHVKFQEFATYPQLQKYMESDSIGVVRFRTRTIIRDGD